MNVVRQRHFDDLAAHCVVAEQPGACKGSYHVGFT